MKNKKQIRKQFVSADLLLSDSYHIWEIYLVCPAGHIAADVAKNKYFDRRRSALELAEDEKSRPGVM